MSNANTSFLQTMCGISDDYFELITTLNNDEIHTEHVEMFGKFSQLRIEKLQKKFARTIIDQKKKLVAQIPPCSTNTIRSESLTEQIKEKYGSLKTFFEREILTNTNIPSGLTLQYRNMKEITDEDLSLLIEALYVNGDLKIEDDKN